MMLPSIHLNGTSKESLFEDNRDAMFAIQEAIAALIKAAPHGRDYYPQGPGAYAKARDEHMARLAALGKIADDLHNIALHTH